MSYWAHYVPASPNGYNPTKGGFATEDEAWDYVYSRMCESCQASRQRALQGFEDYERDGEMYECSEHPACACEWMVDDEAPEQN